MKAAVFERYGTSEVLELREVEKPIPKDDEVLVKVYAVAINDWDWQILQGIPFANRMTFGLWRPRKQILGSDVAGRVEAVGAEVKRFRPGDEVFGDLSGRWGGFAEYVCARQDALVVKPADMTWTEAAAIPQAALLALQGLQDMGGIAKGQKVLVNGAGGGVGTFAIQLARLYEADEVTGVDSAPKLDAMRMLGFDRVIDYAEEDFTAGGQRYDLILDVKTDRSIFKYARVLRPGGTYVTVGGSTGRIIQILLMGRVTALLSKKRMRLVILKPNKDLAYVAQLFEAGTFKPVIDGQYRLNDVREAMRYFGEGRHTGKVVITVDDEPGSAQGR